MKIISTRLTRGERGFTLLEIIIVIIIVGILASLALPRFMKTVEYSRAVEAFIGLNVVRQSMEHCYLQRSTYSGCDAFTNLDIENPALSSNNHFTYFWPAPATTNTFVIRAERTTRDGGSGGDYIQLFDNGAIITRSGTSAFQGIQ